MYIINLDNNYLIKRYRMNVILLRHGETDHNKSGLSQCGDIDTIMNEQGVKQLMRDNLKSSSYQSWRKRVQGRSTKHLAKRGFSVGRHKSHDQNKL